MKAIAFFFVVFLSMLSAFLLATGEVQRWITGEPGLGTSESPPWIGKDPDTDSENRLDFPFWDVDAGRLSFTIKAELSQENFDVKNQLDNIDHLTLRNGVLEIPLHESIELTGEETSGGPPGSAVAEPSPNHNPVSQPLRATNTKPPLSPTTGVDRQVVMTFDAAEWHRQMEDGNDAMHVVLRDGEGKTSDGVEFFFETLNFHYEKASDDPFTMKSDRPVSIVNSGFRLHSPNGLEGTLEQEGDGLESLTFLPPVTVEIDPTRTPFLPVATDSIPETDESDSSDARSEKRGVRITTGGPLVLHQRPGQTTITLNKDIFVLPVGVDASQPADKANTRFECQHLELFFTKQGRRLLPERAVATWPDGRVKAFFQSASRKNESYVIDSERLVWTYRLPEGSLPTNDPPVAVSEAELLGEPTLLGSNGSSFDAERALLRLNEGSILLSQVSGHFQAVSKQPDSPKTNPLTALDTDLPPEPQSEESERHRRLNMETAELEIFFSSSEGGSHQELSHFVARSDESGGVRIESPGEKKDQPFLLEASRAVYRHAKQVVTLTGASEEKPTFRQGKNEVSSRRIQLFLKDELAIFQESVAAKILDAVSLKDAGQGGAIPLTARRGESPFELNANLLQAGFDGTTHELRYLRARGSETRRAQLRSLDGNGFTLDGDDMRWDRERETMTVEGSAVLDYKGGKLAANKITYDTQSRVAILERGATLDTARGDQRVQLRCAGGRVELFKEGDAQLADTANDSDGRGLLSELRGVKAFQAFEGQQEPIVLTVFQSDDSVILRGRAQEAEWSGEKQELRLFGDEDQEVYIADERIQGPIHAPEVIYLEKAQRLVLKGKVRGHLRQGGVDLVPSNKPDAKDDAGPIWKYESGRLEIDLRRNPQTGQPEVVSVSAHDFVRLEDNRGLQVLGDELEYNAETHRVHLFSAGRSQTLSYTPPDRPNSPDRIDAQEIWLLPYMDDRARSPTSKRWLQVQFADEVTATLYPSSTRKSSNLKKGAPVQLDSDSLVLRVDPAHDRANAIQRAEAVGNVVFRSRDYTGTGDRADYIDSLAQITLAGNPARVTARGTWESDRIICQLRGDDMQITVQPPKATRRTRR